MGLVLIHLLASTLLLLTSGVRIDARFNSLSHLPAQSTFNDRSRPTADYDYDLEPFDNDDLRAIQVCVLLDLPAGTVDG